MRTSNENISYCSQGSHLYPGRESGFLYRPRHIFPGMILKLTLRQKIIYPVPLGFVKKQKYYPKQPREGQHLIFRDVPKMSFEKVACYWRSDFFDISPQVALCSVPFLHCRSDTVCLLFRVRCFRAPVRPAPRVQLVGYGLTRASSAELLAPQAILTSHRKRWTSDLFSSKLHSTNQLALKFLSSHNGL